jgi:transposase InsO family protein
LAHFDADLEGSVHLITQNNFIVGEPLRGTEKMKADVFEYIEVDYNRKRRHSANGYISPMCFEAKMN